MTVKELRTILASMPENAEILIAFDPNLAHDCEEDSYQLTKIALVVYDSVDNVVELREDWR